MTTEIETAQNAALDAIERLIETQVTIAPEMKPALAARLERLARSLGGRSVGPGMAPEAPPPAPYPFTHALELEPVRLALEDLARRALKRDDRALVERAIEIDARHRAWLAATTRNHPTKRSA